MVPWLVVRLLSEIRRGEVYTIALTIESCQLIEVKLKPPIQPAGLVWWSTTQAMQMSLAFYFSGRTPLAVILGAVIGVRTLKGQVVSV